MNEEKWEGLSENREHKTTETEAGGSPELAELSEQAAGDEMPHPAGFSVGRWVTARPQRDSSKRRGNDQDSQPSHCLPDLPEPSSVQPHLP